MPFLKKIFQYDGIVICHGSGKNCWAAAVSEMPFRAPGKDSKLYDPVLEKLAEELNSAFAEAKASKGDDEPCLIFTLTDDYIVPVWGICDGVLFSEIDGDKEKELLGFLED